MNPETIMLLVQARQNALLEEARREGQARMVRRSGRDARSAADRVRLLMVGAAVMVRGARRTGSIVGSVRTATEQ